MATLQILGQAPSDFSADPFNHPLFPLMVVGFLVLVTMILVMTVAVLMIRVLNAMALQAAKEKAERAGQTYVAPVTWWDNFWQNFNNSVPLTKESDIDMGHNYDGIRELDNHLPPWWKGLFYGTAVWAAGYLLVFHVFNSFPLSIGEYDNDVEMARQQVMAFKASQPKEEIDENSLVFTKDETIIANGKKVFMSNNCGSCHRADAGGSTIGPNLTDAYWIHGGDLKNVFTTIKNGVLEKGMPAWGKVMTPQDVRDVAFYVMSLQGSNPPNPKAPQGELFVPAKTDTTAIKPIAEK